MANTKKEKTTKKTKKTPTGKRGKHYTPTQKQKILARYRDLRTHGVKAVEAAKKVGVSYLTIQKWGANGLEKVRTKPRTNLKPDPFEGITLKTPGGFVIKNLSRQDLIAVLQAL